MEICEFAVRVRVCEIQSAVIRVAPLFALRVWPDHRFHCPPQAKHGGPNRSRKDHNNKIFPKRERERDRKIPLLPHLFAGVS